MPPWARKRDDPDEEWRTFAEKAFSSDTRGSLGVLDPPAAAPPECAVAVVAAAKSVWAEHPTPTSLGAVGGACVPASRWGCVPLVAYCDPRLPLQVGGGTRWAPPGVWQVGGTGAWVRCVCTRSAPHGVVSLGAEGGRCWGCNVQLALASPTLQPWCGRAYRACPFPTSHSWWRRVVTVRAASLECDPQDVEPQGGSLG